MQKMSRATAEKIREIGNNLPEIAVLYQQDASKPLSDRVRIMTELAYGEHERHVLDIYLPVDMKPDQAVPVVIFFHGGGFIRGDKKHRQNIGCFLAEQGFATILANYRLAPKVQWPSGAEDVAHVWQWVISNADSTALAIQFDTQKIFLMGESAGAAHVASIALNTRLQPKDWQISGAILLSGPYNPKLEHLAAQQLSIQQPDVRNESYFGIDRQAWDRAATIDLIDAKPFPLLVSFTELDLPQMQVQASELFTKLVCQHGYQPELLIVPDHNHFSQGYSFGLEDTSVSQPILDFLRKNLSQ